MASVIQWFFSLPPVRQQRVIAAVKVLRKAGVKADEALIIICDSSSDVPGVGVVGVVDVVGGSRF